MHDKSKLIVVGLLCSLSAVAFADPLSLEAKRLQERSDSRRAEVRSLVDLLRLEHLRDWLAGGQVDAHLKAASKQTDRHPLSQAVALWLRHKNALRHFDKDTASNTRNALGLMSHFIYRPTGAPHPIAALSPSEWTRYPRTEATGVIRLGAFITQPMVPTATLATSLHSQQERSAVLRFGYRDKAKIWLNGDIIFDGGQSHDYWLDQHAVLCHLRAGRNRLVIELTDASEQWAFVGRMTDHIGRPIAVTDEFPVETAVPEAIDGALIDGLISPWSVLSAATMSTPPQVDALIDMAWYAAKSGMPGRERTLEEVALEGAYAERTDAQTLHAWTLLLDGSRAARQRASHVPIASESQGAAGLMLRLDTAWEHFFARRLEQAWSDGRALYREHPRLSPVQRLWALLHEDLGFVDTARRLAETHLADAAQPSLGHRQTYLGALQVSGALTKEISVLQQHFDDGHATEAMRLRLAEIHRRQGHHERADTIIENMVELRPELWPMQLVGVDALRERGQVRKALGRLETIVGLAPHHTAWVERYVGLLVDTGQRAKAEQLVSLNRERLTEEASGRLSRLVDFTERAPSLGPSRKTLTPIECGSHDAIVRYHHARLRLASAGKATRWVRRVIKICTDIGAEGFGKIRLTHIPDSQTLAVLKASRIRDNQQLTGRMTSKALSDPVNRLYYDLQETTVHFDDLVKGDVLEVVWRIRDTQPHAAMPGHYGEVAYLQESIPRHHTVLDFESEGERPLYTGLSSQGISLTVKPGRIEGFNIPASPAADDGPGLTDRFAYVHLSTQERWSEVDGLYQALLGRRASVTPQIKAAALNAIAGATGPREVIAKLYRLVADRIRYVGLEYGIHSFQPAHASETWSLGYGDCKDKAVLLIAMLSAVGIPSQFVLVRTRSAGAIERKPASLSAFDHAIVYLPGLKAFIDPTVSDFDPFVLPTEDQGAQVLVVGSGELTRVPVTAAALNREEWTVTLEKTNNTLFGTVAAKIIGQGATHLRRKLSDLNQRERRAKNWLNQLIPQAQFSDIEYSGVTPTRDPVTLDARVQSPAALNSSQRMSLRLGLSSWRLVESLAPDARRTQPLVLPQRSQRLVKTTLKGIRIGNGPALKGTIKSRFGELRVDYHEGADSADLTVSLTLQKRIISAAAYPDFRRWLAAVDSMLSTPLRMSDDES